MRQFRAATSAALIVMLSACGGGGGDGSFPPPSGGGGGGGGLPPPSSAPALKTTLAAKYGVVDFPVGAAIEPSSTTNSPDRDILLKHYSSITAENAMKPDTVWPNKAGTGGATSLPAETAACISSMISSRCIEAVSSTRAPCGADATTSAGTSEPA